MALGKLILRVVVGGVFIGHGLQKLTGQFDGPGLAGTTAMMEKTRMYPAKRNALAAALLETLGGVGIVLGAATPVATAATTAAMATAIRKVHLANGPWVSKGGYEYNATLIAAAAALTIDGPGPISVDAVVGKSRWGLFCGLLAVGAGVLASSFAIELGELAAPPADAEPDAAATR